MNDDATCLGGAARDNELAAESGTDKEEESRFSVVTDCRLNLLVLKRNKIRVNNTFYRDFVPNLEQRKCKA